MLIHRRIYHIRKRLNLPTSMLRPRIFGVVISESWSGGVEIDISQSGYAVWAVGFEAGEVVAGKGRRWELVGVRDR